MNLMGQKEITGLGGHESNRRLGTRESLNQVRDYLISCVTQLAQIKDIQRGQSPDKNSASTLPSGPMGLDQACEVLIGIASGLEKELACLREELS